MKQRVCLAALVVVTIGLTLPGCGSSGRVTTTAKVSTPASEPGPIPIADDTAAVAALDGSAAFSVRDDQLVRVDPTTSEVEQSWAVPHDTTSISAVAPEGRWVALTDRTEPGYDASQPRIFTELVVFDPAAGIETHRYTLSGDVRPEAFSVNGRLVFALDHQGDHYRVQTITLATGERFDTSNRDKTPEVEEMNGTSVRAVLNADRTLLSTLYRNPGDDDEPAFVHILDLVHGWAYCADLPPPFGTGPPGTDLIELTTADTVVVTATQASRIAEIHIDEVRTPSAKPVTVEFRNATA